jgi:hypothetical protein
MPFAFNPITGKLDLVGSGGGGNPFDQSLNATDSVGFNAVNVSDPDGYFTNISAGSISATGAYGSWSITNSGSAFFDDQISCNDISVNGKTPAFLSGGNTFTATQTITAAANTSALTATYSVTGANTTPLLDLSGTWNTTGVARGILLNVTETVAAPSASTLLDLRVGGTSKFKVDKAGTIFNGAAYLSNALILTGAIVSNSGVALASTSTLSFRNNTNAEVGTGDLFLFRDAASTLALRNGGTAASPVPQNFRVYNYTDAALTNYERGFMRWNANTLEIGTEAGGTGTGRVMNLTSAGFIDMYSAGTLQFRVRSTGVFAFTGLEWNFTSLSADATTADVTAGRCRVIKNTTSGVIRLYVNDGGTMKSVVLA